MAARIFLRACVFLAMFGSSNAKAINDLGQTTMEEVEAEIASELAGHLKPSRVAGIEAVLGAMYKSLPKNANGRLGHQAVRYALHRLFVLRHGWYIKGLEPGSAPSASITGVDWIPAYVQGKLEEHLGNNGMTLHELASFGAAVDDLIRNEAGKRLKDIYQVLRLSTEAKITKEQAQDVLDTYAMTYLLSTKKNITINGPTETARKRKIFAAKYKNYTEFQAWFTVLEQRHMAPLAAEGEVVSFTQMAHIVEDFGERYGTFNDLECRALKASLIAHEGKGRGMGRVRLSDFYNMSRYSHWKLNEKAEYLRDLGALDDSNATQSLVIVPNYIQSRPNCLEATSLYSVCCRDECEDLIGRLERDVKEPTARAEKIAGLVATYSSDTVQAPRTLSEGLIRRLQEMSVLHGGEVDLHGRLFAQWMHHAFPRECPYPHESGTTSPVSADEWMKAKGHESEQATEDEVQKVLDGACSIDGGELPWNPTEELLDASAPRQPVRALLLIAMSVAALWAIFGLWYAAASMNNKKGLKQDQVKAISVFVGISLLAAVLIALDLVDTVVIFIILGVGVLIDLARRFQFFDQAAPKLAGSSGWAEEKLV